MEIPGKKADRLKADRLRRKWVDSRGDSSIELIRTRIFGLKGKRRERGKSLKYGSPSRDNVYCCVPDTGRYYPTF